MSIVFRGGTLDSVLDEQNMAASLERDLKFIYIYPSSSITFEDCDTRSTTTSIF
jgi:hypothetical protein